MAAFPCQLQSLDRNFGLMGCDCSELSSFPPEAHWFCPRTDDDDPVNYDTPDEVDPDEDITLAQKKQRITDSKERYRVAYECILSLGLSDDEAGPLRSQYLEGLGRLLSQCDKCVRNYHIGRKRYLTDLGQRFDEMTVNALSQRIDAHDFTRINAGLDQAYQILSSHPEASRNKNVLMRESPASLIALYEALCCEPFHSNDANLASVFDDVFEMVQTKKVLRLGQILPSMSHFLFDVRATRHRFAISAWNSLPGNLTESQFDWAVNNGLSKAITHVSWQNVSLADVQRFWGSVRSILDRLDQDLITHSLRAMEVQPNIYLLALQHLTFDSEDILTSIIRCLCCLITKSPKDFWAAYSAMSPRTVTEQIFNSPAFKRSLANQGGVDDIPQESNLPYVTSWIVPFLKSLPSTHQYDACNGLLHQLLERLQTDQIPEESRLACMCSGLEALHHTLSTFVDPKHKINAMTGRIVVNNVLGLVDRYKEAIMHCADLARDTEMNITLSNLGMQVIRNTLSLDCKALDAEYHALESDQQVQQGLHNHSKSIWQAVLDAFTLNSLEMAKSVLIGITPLMGLEKFGQKNSNTPLPKEKLEFNQNFGDLSEIVSRVFERLSDFDTVDLRILFSDQATAYPLIGALTSAEQTTFEAAVEVIKSVTSQSGRRDAIQSLLEEAFAPSLTCFTRSIGRIADIKTFASVPRALKTSRDVLNSLCDSQQGILRVRSMAELRDRLALRNWWEQQWRIMSVAFETTEEWSMQPQNSKEMMTNFARDAMEHSEALFDQYSILASSLDTDSIVDNPSSSSSASKEARKMLLEHPRRSMQFIVKWLRLRDPYLASTLVSLVSKVLRRLGELDMSIDQQPKDYIYNVAVKESVKTILTGQQRAELRRALNEHEGVQIIEIAKPTAPSKQSRLDAWSKSAGGVKHEPTAIATGKKGSVIDMDSWTAKTAQQRDIKALSGTLDQKKSTLDEMRARQVAASKKAPVLIPNLKQQREREKEEKRKRDALAVAKAKALRGTRNVVGEGSGLSGIGVQGIDHAPRSEIMVSDGDSESDEDDDDDDDDANLLLDKGKSRQVTEYEESRRKALAKQQAQGPVRKIKAQRSAKDMRARLAPNMDVLHQAILAWDIFHDSDDPPNGNDCQKVANTFQTPEDYRKTFYPLLISEAWRSFVTAREEGSNSKVFEIKIVNRMSVDRFVEVSTTIPSAENRELGIAEGDIVLLSKGGNPMKDRQAPHCLARVFRTTRKKDIVDVLYRVSSNDATNLVSSLAPNTKIQGVKITSMTTIEREYAALKSLEYYDLCEEILTAKPSPLLKYSDQALSSLVQNYKVNMGQAKAIMSAKDNDAFTLIQGPPGSGKTKTIVAMVGSLLTEQLSAQGVAVNRPQAVGPVGPAAAKPASKKLLICAPSNAAVDELVMRLKQGVKTLRGDFKKINVVRLGRSEAINAGVRDVTIDELVKARMEGGNKENAGAMSERDKLHRDAGTLKLELAALRPKLDEARKKGDKLLEQRLQREFDGKKRMQASIGNKIDEDKDSGNTVARENEINRRRIQQEIIDGAHVLCSTLSGSGHDMFKNLSVEFETVIIDEAAQCIELSALIPLKYGCSKCILVGDPKQLPPTVLSRSAAKFGYEQSLFVRMQQNHPGDIHLLDTQYRMHPEISWFPSQQFYDGKLIDGPGMAELRQKPWHTSSILGPYRFFDVKGIQSSGFKGHSYVNVEEMNVAMQLYERLRIDFSGYDIRGKVGIITPYKAQLRELRLRFQSRYGDEIFDHIDFNTTDAFQGRESEIIIFSCVRARASGGIGFLEDIRRMNVGLTRAKSSLWVLGNSTSLQQGEFWSKLVADARARNRFTEGDVLSLLRKPVPRDVRLSEILTSKPVEDVEMVDLTSNSVSRKSSTDSSTGTLGDNSVTNMQHQVSIEPAVTDETPDPTNILPITAPASQTRQPRLPPGNGLNDKAVCGTCGSYSHTTFDCDNRPAQVAQHMGCHRCHEVGHAKSACPAPRCMNCGEVGHLDQICAGEPMTKFQRSRAIKMESDFEKYKAQAPEKKRRYLVGDHDPKMPTVHVSTASIPSRPLPGENNLGRKRAREPSPTEAYGPSKKVRHDPLYKF
jgi:senataxin